MTVLDDTSLAYKNAHFIDSDESRPLLIQAEYLSPLEVFRRRLVHDTIVCSGSARITFVCACSRSARRSSAIAAACAFSWYHTIRSGSVL